MSWYIGICITVMLFQQIGALVGKTRLDRTRISLLLSLFLLFLMAAFRSVYVGADTQNYYSSYIYLKNSTFIEALASEGRAASGRVISLETGYCIFMWIVGKLLYFCPDTIFMAATHLVILSFLYFTLKEQSPDATLSLWLYVTLGFYQTSLNMSRNAISIMIVLWAIRYIKSSNPFKWCIACIVASSIHTSSLIFIPLYWICKIKFTKKKLFVSIVAVVSAVLIFDRVLPLVVRFIPARYMNYVYSSDAADPEQYLVLLLHLILIAICFVYGMKYKYGTIVINWKGFSRNIYTSFIVMEILFYAAGLHSQGIVRVATAAAPAIILFIPVMIQKIDNVGSRISVTRMIYVLTFVAYIIRMSVNDIGSTQPYQFGF